MIKQYNKLQGAAAPCNSSVISLTGHSSILPTAPLDAQLSPVSLPRLGTCQSAQFASLPDCAFVRLPCLVSLFSCSPATIWRWVKASKLPAPKKLGARISAWNVGDIRQALSARMTDAKYESSKMNG